MSSWNSTEISCHNQTETLPIVQVVNTPFGKRPFRVHVDPTQDGADVAFAVMDRVRAEMLHRVRLSDLLKPHQTKAE